MDNSKKNETKKVSLLQLIRKQKLQDNAEEFADNNVEENEEETLIGFENEVMENNAQILLKKSLNFFNFGRIKTK